VVQLVAMATNNSINDGNIEIKTGTLIKSVQKLKLSSEACNLLERFGGKVVIEIDPSANAPIVRIVDESGKRLISVAEFEKIGTYRRFVETAAAKIEKESSRNDRVSKMARLRTLASAAGITVPTKMLDSNGSKNIEVNMHLKVLHENLERARGLLDDDFKAYIIETGNILDSVLTSELLHTVSGNKVTKEQRMNQLLSYGIPSWMYGKLITRNWIRDEVTEARELLFLKNNFLRGVSLTIRELNDKDFVSVNNVIAQYSRSTIAVMTSGLTEIVPHTHVDAQVRDQLEKAFYEFPVIMHDGDAERVIKPREEGKGPPSISMIKSRTTGRNSSSRREGEAPRLRRELVNWLTKLTHNWELISRGIITVDNTIEQFWSEIYPQSPHWDLTPGKNMYNWIREVDPNLDDFKKIVEFSDEDVRGLLYHVLVTKLDVVNETLIDGFKAHMEHALAQGFMVTPRAGVVRTQTPTTITQIDLDDLDQVTAVQKEEAKAFLRLKDKKSKKKKKNRANMVLLSRDIEARLDLLLQIKDGKKFREDIHEWLRQSFTTAKTTVMEIIAELVVAAALNNDVLYIEENDGTSSEESDDDEN